MIGRTIKILSWSVLAISLVFPPELLADGVSRRVVFPKGKKTVALRGRLPFRYSNYDSYVLRAKKGQTLAIKLVTDDPEAYIDIYETKELGPEEDTILGMNERAREWTGQLPITSEYSVQVYDLSENGINRAPYTIEISLR